MYCSNIDPCPSKNRLARMCSIVHIVTNVNTSTISLFRSRPSRTGSLGQQTSTSHLDSSGILSVKQRNTVKRAVRSAQQAAGSSPGKQTPFDTRCQNAVALHVQTEWRGITNGKASGISMDGTDGSMNHLVESISLATLLERNNDHDDDFHMDKHQIVCVWHQFKDDDCYDEASPQQHGADRQLL